LSQFVADVLVSFVFVSIQGERVYTHKGDRSQAGIVEFAKRAYG